ncbi:MAG: ribulose-phosphate 3-epimerase [Anaerolineaceae bacterium]|nr:ribulose-phosphate 3-epimerase [Anaerolineaceae bacterium]
MTTLISPSILSADFSHLGDDLRACETGGADCIHIDVMDGCFVPNITFGPQIVKTCREVSTLPLDVHLMIVEPEKHLEAFAKAGADSITVHVETCPNLHRTLQTIRELGLSVGVTINPATPVESLREIATIFDMVLVMTVNPGFGGQSFIPQSLDKVRRMRALLEETGSNATIQVDGGISSETIRDVYIAGARNFVAGSSVFNHPEGIQAGIQSLRDAITVL